MEAMFHDGTLRIFRGKWEDRRGAIPLLELAPGWGLGFWVEFPSEWHEDGQGRLVIYPVWGHIYLHFPWFKLYKDHMQCSGPRFGFQFFADLLWLYHGNETGRSGDRAMTTVYMPWHWEFFSHEVINRHDRWMHSVEAAMTFAQRTTHDYTYTLNSGEVQHRKATIFVERRTWRRRFWFPREMTRQGIDVRFSDEVGERTGSWKGGTTGCGYDMKPGETALDCLRRMEVERKFD